MESLTLQIKLGTDWHDAADLSIDPRRPLVQITYTVDHVFPTADSVSNLPETFRAISMRWPLDLAPRTQKRWPALLDDITPGGAARRWWIERKGLRDLPPHEQNLILLRDATIAPIGHLRIGEALGTSRQDEPQTFPVESVLEREYQFIEYAQQQGAAIRGATGAGGDAPKLLLRVRNEHVWIDTAQDDDLDDAFVVVKFPRRSRYRSRNNSPTESTVDRIILESEHVYSRALAQLGVDVVETTLRHSSSDRPSLWLQRFDVEGDEVQTRLGVESLYALTDNPPGKQCDHQTFLHALHRTLVEGGFVNDDDPPQSSEPGSLELVFEYVRRDLLNVVFGNSDNHGRNMAILKTPDGNRLAPVYDFAPMAMDPTGIARSTRWNRDLERREIDWRGVCLAQRHLCDPEALWQRLCAFAMELRDLDERLEALGLPAETLEHPAIRLERTNQRLRRWDLLR